MNESSLAVLQQSARPALAAGSRECSRRILRQVTNRYTRRLSAVTVCTLTLAASARVLASSETPSVAAKQKSDIHPVEKD